MLASAAAPPLGTAQHLIVTKAPVVFTNRILPFRNTVEEGEVGTVNKVSTEALFTCLGANSFEKLSAILNPNHCFKILNAS